MPLGFHTGMKLLHHSANLFTHKGVIMPSSAILNQQSNHSLKTANSQKQPCTYLLAGLSVQYLLWNKHLYFYLAGSNHYRNFWANGLAFVLIGRLVFEFRKNSFLKCGLVINYHYYFTLYVNLHILSCFLLTILLI